MKFKAVSLVLSVILTTFLLTGFADEEKFSYAAKINRDGKVCARTEVRDYSGVSLKVKCRTLAQWLPRGYTVQAPAPLPELDSDAGSNAGE